MTVVKDTRWGCECCTYLSKAQLCSKLTDPGVLSAVLTPALQRRDLRRDPLRLLQPAVLVSVSHCSAGAVGLVTVSESSLMVALNSTLVQAVHTIWSSSY